MKIGTMRTIDTWVGTPLCFLATGIDRILSLFRRPRATPQRALFIELSEMGSAVICGAALRRFRQMHPETEMHFLIFEANRAGIEIVGMIEKARIHTIRHDSLASIAAGLVRIFFVFRRLKFDIVVDLELFSCFTSLLSFLTGAPVKSGFCSTTTAGLYRGNFLSHRVSFNSHVHIVYNYLALVEALTRKGEHPSYKGTMDHLEIDPPKASRNPDNEARLFELIREEARTGDARLELAPGHHRLVMFNPDPGLLPIRGWGYDRFGELAKRLLASDDSLVVVLLGLARARDDYEGIRSQAGSSRCLNFAGRDSGLLDLLSLFFLGDLLVTNDSGPAHFATLCQIPTLTLYGPASPVTYGVINPRASNLSSEFHCSPCLTAHNRRSTSCKDNLCMQALSVDRILEKARELLVEPSPTEPSRT